jgi:hypothetical protein
MEDVGGPADPIFRAARASIQSCSTAHMFNVFSGLRRRLGGNGEKIGNIGLRAGSSSPVYGHPHRR